MANRIQLRRDTAANWTRVNPILEDGEPGLEIDTNKVKYGDGNTAWVDLPYATADATTGWAYTDTLTQYTSTANLAYNFNVDTYNSHLDLNGSGTWSLGSNNNSTKIYSPFTGCVSIQTGDGIYTTFMPDGTTSFPGNLYVSGNINNVDRISANSYVYSNGVSILDGIVAGGSTYGDSNVAAYLYQANLSLHGLNFTASPALTTSKGINWEGGFQTDIYGNTQVAEYLVANPQPGMYGDSNVAAYLTANPQPGTYSNSNVTAYLTSGSLETAWVHGNLTVGNLIVNGNTTTVNTQSYVVSDNIVQYADGNPADVLDVGFVAHRTVGGTLQHTGLVRDASSNYWALFSNVATQPGNTVDFTGVIYDTLRLNSVQGNVDIPSGYINFTSSPAPGTSGITFSDGTHQTSAYANAQVASYLTSQNITSANIGGSQTYANTRISTLEANVGSFYTYANATFGTSNYSNTNVAAYLTTATINTSGNITAGNLIGAHYGNAVGTTATYTGNVTAANFVGTVVGNLTGNVTGNVTGTTPNISLVAGSYTTTLDNTGRATFPGNVTVNGTQGITMPNRPAFRIYGGSPAWHNTGNVNLKGSSITVDYNQGSYFNSTTGVFTVPVDGLYSVTLNARVGSLNAQGQIMVIKNGLTTPGNVAVMWEADTNTGTAVHFGVCSTVKLAAGDWLTANITAGNIQFDQNDSWSVTYLG